jgi:GNAT superfamily N-acetyltransferase
MTSTDVGAALAIRPYREDDESVVLGLLASALGGGPDGRRSPEFFRWKHFDNPFGTSLLLVAETGGEIVGLRAFLRWRFTAGDGSIRAARAVDTVTHPDHQGKGIFSRLTKHAVELLREDTDLIFNTPNSLSLPGYLKMGWRMVGKVPIQVGVRRPVSFALGLRSVSSFTRTPGREISVKAPVAADALTGGARLRAFLEESRRVDDRITTPLSVEYLAWRYARTPLDYRAIVEEGHHGIEGIAVFRVRPRGVLWEATIADLLVRPGDRQMASRLLDHVSRSARVDDITCHFPPRSAQLAAVRRKGFLRSPRGQLLTVNPLGKGVANMSSNLDSWSVSLGTLEVF